MFEKKLFKKGINIIQISASFSFSRQTRIINYFKLVTFSINQNLKLSKILLSSFNLIKLKSFKNELFKTLTFFSSISQSTRTLLNHKSITFKKFSSKRLHFIFSSNFFCFFQICRFCLTIFIYNNDLHRHFRN